MVSAKTDFIRGEIVLTVIYFFTFMRSYLLNNVNKQELGDNLEDLIKE